VLKDNVKLFLGFRLDQYISVKSAKDLRKLIGLEVKTEVHVNFKQNN